MRYSKLLILLATVAVLSACGGGNVAVTPVPTTQSTTPTAEVTGLNGIWEGDYTNSSGTVCTDVKGLTYNGSVRVISEKCNLVLAGTLSVNGGNANIDFELFDTAGVGTGQSTFSGSFTLQSSIDGSLDNGSRLSLRYQPVYENDSSLGLITGNWSVSETVGDTAYLNFFSIDGAGKLVTRLSVASDCDYTATFSILDANYDLYGVALTISNCASSIQNRNGVYTGLASLSGDNKTITVLVGNEQNTFFADFSKVTGTIN